ncbi:alpha-2-macroglobulin receptor-associated protein isoform X2 [Scyliorhinus canicula]|uniref:alpha-2-macroglobulin receptor-associated protein isoform X2 n=1 Tax=Scyliorhinus canicula TaxID=7830 RepID=UPI0018F6F90D|nr:alpha-2-macroglobulin receptor-associated protein isoform X2 [Scyliorhinus canicula]
MAGCWVRLALITVCLLPCPAQAGGKYSREKNEVDADGKAEIEFRMAKLNQVWEKAQRLQFSPVKLAELHSDLKIQEKDELNWKKLKADGLDEDGEKEAMMRRNFNVILTKYRLDGRKDAAAMDTNYLKDSMDSENDVFDDPKLEKLWNKATTSGKFNNDEVRKLRREFQHHQDKIQEYHILRETVSRNEDIYQNVISPSEAHVKEDLLHSKHTQLKDKHRNVEASFQRLRKLINQEFSEPRVLELWDMAKQSNFTADELDSIKEELKHFETKIEKHQHYKEQLDLSHQKLKHVETIGDKEHLSRNKEKYAMLTEKTKELGYKVKKHMQDLLARLSKGGLNHNEL